MVSVNGANSDLAVRKSQLEDSDTSVSRASGQSQPVVKGGNFGEDVQFKATKEPNVEDFNFSHFGDKYAFAAEMEMADVLSDLKKEIAKYNKENPTRQIVIDYSSMPKPEDFAVKNNTTKKKLKGEALEKAQFQAYTLFQKRLNDWKELNTIENLLSQEQTAEER